MKSVYTINCHEGDVLAEDIYSNEGIILVTKNTVMNDYIKMKLTDFGIFEVKIYEVVKDNKIYSKFEKRYKEHLLQIKELLRSVSLGTYDEVEKITSFMTDQIYKNISDSEYIIYCINRIRTNDEYTYTHSINTAFYSMLLGNWLGFTRKQIYEVVGASLIHDIGKTKIPPEILNKKGKLDKAEFDIMKTHPVLGHEIIKDMTGFHKDMKQAVLMHHERMDGSGYPYGLQGKSICQYAKIIAIADVFDAMTQNRIYKDKVSPFHSFEMFLTDGIRLFDYSILCVFLKHMAPLYIGNRVQLSNGDIAEIVFVPPQDITSPILYSNSRYLDLSKHNEIKVLQLL